MASVRVSARYFGGPFGVDVEDVFVDGAVVDHFRQAEVHGVAVGKSTGDGEEVGAAFELLYVGLKFDFDDQVLG